MLRNRIDKMYPWFVCITADMLFFYEFIQTNMFSAINIEVVNQFKLNSFQLSFLSSAYFYSSSLLIIIAGLLLDRFSTKRIIILAMLFCSIGTLGFAFSSRFITALIFRFMSGIGNAFSLLACVKLASRWFPSNRLALLTGISVAIAMAGGITAQVPLAIIVKEFGWQNALIFDAFLGFCITAIIQLIVKDYPENKESEISKEIILTNSYNVLESLKITIKNTQNLLASIYTSLLNLTIFVLGAVWGSLYLMQVYGFTHLTATYIVSMIFFGTLLGAPFFGYVSDAIKKRRSIMIIGSLLSVVTLIIISMTNDPSIFSLKTLFFLLGFFTSSQVISYPLVAEHNPKIFTATSVSFVSLSAILGGIFGQPIFGWLINLSYKDMLNQHIIYAHVYSRGMLFLILTAFIAGICSFFIRETNCKPQNVISEHGKIADVGI